MKQNKKTTIKSNREDTSLDGSPEIGNRSRRGDVAEAIELKGIFTLSVEDTTGDEFEARIMRGPTDDDLLRMEREEAAQRWHEREMSPAELAEQEKWNTFALETATKAIRRHRIVVKEKKSKPQKVHAVVIPATPGASATDHFLDVNYQLHREHSGEIDKAS